MQSIFLIGFMGSGKTNFGKKLATHLKMNFVDLDELVAEKTGTGSVKDLIDEKGMDFFRKTESETLKSLGPQNAIISTGGGTPCYWDNLEWMKSNGVVVFLSVDEDVIFNRLSNTDFEKRPLLKDLDLAGLKDFIHTKLRERLPFYTQAHIIFDPVHEKIEDLTRQLNASALFR